MANHLPLVSNHTSKNKKRQHPRRNGTRVENVMELTQVDLARISGENVLVSEEWFFRPKAVTVARSRVVQQNR